VDCDRPLKFSKTLPYQMVLRVIGAREKDYESSYDVLFAFFCRKCQTTQSTSLIVIDETAYYVMCKAIASFAFTQTLFLNMDGLDVVSKYLERFEEINKSVPEFLAHVLGVHTCFHCCLKRDVQVCSTCKSVYFCTSGNCKRMSEIYHCHPDPDIGLCNALKKSHLFHVEFALYVDDAGECRYTSRLSNMEI
jgi:hypothetical protein